MTPSGPALVLILALVVHRTMGGGALRRIVRALEGAGPLWCRSGLALLLPPLMAGAALLVIGWVNLPPPVEAALSVLLLHATLTLGREADSATVESLATGAVRGFVAPVAYYALLGAPGAVLYAAAACADAGACLWLRRGLDAVPQWLTGALLLAAGALRGLEVRAGISALARGRTAPAAAVLDALVPAARRTDEAWRTVALATLLAAAVALLFLWRRHAFLV